MPRTRPRLVRIVALIVCLVIALTESVFAVDVSRRRRLEAIAEKAPSAYVKVQASSLILDHVRIVDGTGAPPRDDQVIVIEGGKLTYVGSRSGLPKIQNAKKLDLRGRTVLPGLVALHEHLFTTAPLETPQRRLVEQGTVFPLMYLAAGVTTIRTAGSIAPDRDLAVKQKIVQGAAVGPEMFLTAPYLQGEPSSFPEMHALANPEEARKAVDYWAERGMTSFKAYTDITAGELEESVQAAHAHGLKITGHLCSIGFNEAADLGVDNLEHGLLADTEFYSKRSPGTCPDFRFVLAEYNDRLSVGSEPVQNMIRHLVARHVAVTSTLAVFESELSGPRPREESERAARAMTSQAWRASRERAQMVPASKVNHLLSKEMEFERDFVQMGGLLLAGCDPTGDGSTLAGFGDQRELELLVEAGFSPVEAIQIATQNGAQFLGIDDRVGSVSSGKQADLIVVKGNPALNISDVKKVEIVFRKGVGYDPAKLLVGIRGVVGLEN